MNRQFSQYLDALRVIAALLVLFAHLSDPAITDGAIGGPSQIGYSAVMIFFVLSGYVISYVAAERESTLPDFAISRISRVYSVVLPAIALTVMVDIMFMSIPPTVNAQALLAGIPAYQYDKFPKYLIMTLLFGNELWGLREPAFSNGVYWSMCFEVYYYILFAGAFYLRGARRVMFLMVALPIIGVGPLLRFPLWLFGCAAYWLHSRCHLSVRPARLIFTITAVALIWDLATDINLRIDESLDSLTNGWVGQSTFRRLVGDTLTGLIVTTNIFSARYTEFNFGRLGYLFTYLASFSFSLYLMHGPLLRFCSAYLHPGAVATVAMVLASVWLLGQFTERQKDHIRNILRRVFGIVPR